MTDREPEPPSAEQIAAFEEWRARWEQAQKEAEDNGWLFYPDYPDDGFPYSPQVRYEKRLDDWRARERSRERLAQEVAQNALQAKADKAAEEARRRVLRGEFR